MVGMSPPPEILKDRCLTILDEGASVSHAEVHGQLIVVRSRAIDLEREQFTLPLNARTKDGVVKMS